MAFLTATGALGLEERCYSSPKWCCLHRLQPLYTTTDRYKLQHKSVKN